MLRVIALLGATGKTGSRVLAGALDRGDRVQALVRDPDRLPRQGDRLTAITGDILDPTAVVAAVRGSDAVISTIGHVKGSPPDVQARGIHNVIQAMEANGVRRLISLTGAGVRDEADTPGVADHLFRVALKLTARHVLADAEAHREVIETSTLDWTIVRAPRLTEKPASHRYRVGHVGQGSGTQLSRADLADFLLSLTDDTSYRHQLPFVSA